MFPAISSPPIAQAGDLRAYQGGHFRVLVAPSQTQEAFALLDLTLPRGAGLPRHVRAHAGETFHLLQGEITFQVGDETIAARPGQAVVAPRQVPHGFTVVSPEARLLVFLPPGKLIEHFLAFSGPLPSVRPVQAPAPFEVMLAMTYALRSQQGAGVC